MSDLLIITIVLGAFIIIGVLVYNWLQEKKLYKQVNSDFIVPQKDVLVDDFYIDSDAFVKKELAKITQKQNQASIEKVSLSNSNNDTSLEQTEKPKAPFSVETTTYAYTEHQHLAVERNGSTDSTADDSGFRVDTTDEAILNPINKAKNFQAEATAEYTSPVFSSARQVEKPSAEPIAAIFDDAPLQLPSEVHPQIDLTAVLYANKSITIQSLQQLSENIDSIGLSVMMYGMDENTKWHLIHLNDSAQSHPNATSFRQVTCSLQLADRGGPVTKNVLNKFQYAVENMGLELNAHVEWQGSGDVLQRAIDIDKFCIEVDQLINIHIAQGESPIHGTKFRGLAEANGMILNEDGKFYFHDATAHSSTFKLPLFSAIESNNQAFTAESLRNNLLKTITFQLEIPKVPSCEQAFNQMILVAQKLSSSLNANLVDDNQRVLGDLQIEKIRQQLKVIHATMVARGVMPGSAASLRLFN